NYKGGVLSSARPSRTRRSARPQAANAATEKHNLETSGGNMASILYSDVRKGMVILGDDKQLYYVVDRELKTPGNLPSKLTLKLKNLKTGFVNEKRFHPEDKVEQAYLEKRTMEYLYKDRDGYVFMDTQTYDQDTLSEDMVGQLMPYLKEGNRVEVTL